MSVMALGELRDGRFLTPRQREFTYEEAVGRSNDRWIKKYERDGMSIRDVLRGRVSVGRFVSSQLEVIIDLIYTFLDAEREN